MVEVETDPVPVTVTAPVAPEMDMPEPATMEVTPELVMDGETVPTTVKEEQATPEEQEADEVATDPSFAGVPLVVVQKDNCPAVSPVPVATLLLKVLKLAAVRHPKAVAEPVLQAIDG